MSCDISYADHLSFNRDARQSRANNKPSGWFLTHVLTQHRAASHSALRNAWCAQDTHTKHFPACFYFSAARGGWSWRFVGHGAVHVAAANPPQTPQPPRTTAQHTRAFSAAPLLRILRPVQLKAEGALRGLLKQRTNFAVASLSLSSRPQWPAAHERERGQSTGVFKTRKLGIRYEQEL